jgi:hypothetical protein
MNTSKSARQLTAIASMIAIACAGSASAQSLIGSGAHLPIPSPNPGAPATVAATITPVGGGFTGTWSTPAPGAWIGTYTATGVLPNTPPGTTNFDFTSLPTGGLPSSTFVTLGDLDGGSASGETSVLKAFDATGAQITTAWIEKPSHYWGNVLTVEAMPGWSFAGGVYTFDGTTQTGPNPSNAVAMRTNTKISKLQLVQTGTNHTLGLAAPLDCYADCDGNGTLNIDDFICFQTFFALGC